MRLEIDDRNMRRFIRQMPAAGKRSTARSLNKAIGQARTLAAREVSDKRNIKISRAKEQMRLHKANTTKPEAAIIARGKPIPVIDVKGSKRQTKAGVKVKLTARGKAHLFEGAFLAKMASGHVGVFRRGGNLKRVSRGNSKGTSRGNLPIMEMTIPSVPATMVQKDIDRKLRTTSERIFLAEQARLLAIEMKKAGAT
jgi:hypothetical protein